MKEQAGSQFIDLVPKGSRAKWMPRLGAWAPKGHVSLAFCPEQIQPRLLVDRWGLASGL